MAILHFNGFDHYSNNAMTSDPMYNDSGSGVYFSAGNSGRFGTGRYMYAASLNYCVLDLGQEYSTLVIGLAVRVYDAYTNPGYPLLSLKDNNKGAQIELFTNDGNANNKYFQVYRDSGRSNLLGVESDSWLMDTWYYYELKVVVHDTTGSVELKRNETTILNLSGIDTKATSETGIQYIRFNYQAHYDDLYVDDANFLGECRVKTFYPDSDETHSDFTRSTGSNDYECVDESQNNDDTDYIDSSTPGDKSTFGITTGSLSTVHGIRIDERVRKTDAGAKTARIVLRSNGADYTGDTEDILDSWSYINKIYLTDPDDSNAWTQTKLEACEYGIEHVS